MPTLKVLKDYTNTTRGSVTITKRLTREKIVLVGIGIEKTKEQTWLAQCNCQHNTQWEVQHTQITDTSPSHCKHCAPASNRSPRGPDTGRTKHPSYSSWMSLKKRCDNPEHPAYHRYGGRGITYTARWNTFEHFAKDMGIRPPNHSIDRIDNDKGYFRNNCRWATPKQQANNRSNNKIK